jgi:SAM-dependent methyltransferase
VDPDAYRRESRERWNLAAPGWLARADRMEAAGMPVSAWLVDAIAPQPGHTVLELAAGTGDVGLLVAELVTPGGEVIVSDFSPGMLTAAQERARARGVANVRFRQIDAESIDWPAASLDAVICRWGLMLLADPGAALREIRRVLRPGRRLALAAWAGRDDNPWRALMDVGLGAPAEDSGPGMFAWGDPQTIASQLEEAGFLEHHVEAVGLEWAFASAAAWIDETRQISPNFAEAVAGREEELREALERVAAPYAQPDGSLRLPGRSWVAWASA